MYLTNPILYLQNHSESHSHQFFYKKIWKLNWINWINSVLHSISLTSQVPILHATRGVKTRSIRSLASQWVIYILVHSPWKILRSKNSTKIIPATCEECEWHIYSDQKEKEWSFHGAVNPPCLAPSLPLLKIKKSNTEGRGKFIQQMFTQKIICLRKLLLEYIF